MKQRKLLNSLTGLGLLSLLAAGGASAAGVSSISFGATALTVGFFHHTCATPPVFSVTVGKSKGTDTLDPRVSADCTDLPFTKTTIAFDYATHGIVPSKKYSIINSISVF